MDKPRDPVTIVLDRVEAVALTEDDSQWNEGIHTRARQRIRESLGTDSLRRAAQSHRESRNYWPEEA